jgi:nucleoside-diphosphate-sugar epimerase
MTSKRIFLTGASGCIGHYIVEALMQATQHELFLLVRNPDKLKFDVQARPGVTVLRSDIRDIEQYSDLLKTIDCAILTATSWGGADEVYQVNVDKNLKLLELLDLDRCQQVIYFSTESILDRQNQLLKEAEEIGSDYIRSKYICYSKLGQLAIAPKITTLFPTLVFGGDDRHPYSHISAGIGEVVKWCKLIRFFQADGSFHFIHGKDIAQIVQHLIDHPPSVGESRDLVLGNARVTVDQAITEICTYLNHAPLLGIPLSPWLIDLFIVLFRVQIGNWERFSLHYRHFTHQTVINPSAFGLVPYCATIGDLLQASGIAPAQSPSG